MDELKKALFNGHGVTNGVLIWAFRLVVIAGFFWLKSEFVTKDTYSADQAKNLSELVQIGKTLQHISDQNDNANKINDDQEARIRQLERIRR